MKRGAAARELPLTARKPIAAIRVRSDARYFEMYHSASALARDG